MASPMAVAVMTKKALELAEDKRVRTLLASIVAGIVIVMLIPLLVMVSIFNTQAGFSQEVARIVFDGGPIPTDIDAEPVSYTHPLVWCLLLQHRLISGIFLEFKSGKIH